MFLKNFHALFVSTLMISTLVAISANSWFTAWLALEINLMSMIPLMLNKLSPNFTEAAIKYFLAQALASIFLIFPATLLFSNMDNLNLEVTETLLAAALALKAGMAPLHFWFPQVIINLSWTQALIVFTWQKIAPIILIASLNIKIIVFLTSLSAIVGALGGFNQIILKLILTYSSISHSSWMLMSCATGIKYWLTYFSIYCFLSLAIIISFKNNKTNKFNEIFQSQDSSLNKNSLILNILSLGGLPPLLGFSAKLNIITPVLYSSFLLIFIPLIFSSLVSLFYYCRLIYSNFFNISNKLYIQSKNWNPVSRVFFSLSTFFNLSAPLFFIL